MINLNIKKHFFIDYLDGFTDIHSHLLPDIDDGVQNTDHSIYIINRLADYGVKNFITTPHIMADIYPNTRHTIKNSLKILEMEMENKGLNDISIHVAAEYMLDTNFNTLLDKNELLPLKDNYLLIELSYYQPPISLENTLLKIVKAGYNPVLAHPERYSYFHNKLNAYHELKNMGCLFQMNALSLSSYYGKYVKKTGDYLLQEGLIDFIGTDIHHAYHTREITDMSLSIKNLKLILPVIENTKAIFSF